MSFSISFASLPKLAVVSGLSWLLKVFEGWPRKASRLHGLFQAFRSVSPQGLTVEVDGRCQVHLSREMAFTTYCDAGGRNSRPHLGAASSTLAMNSPVMGGIAAERSSTG